MFVLSPHDESLREGWAGVASFYCLLGEHTCVDCATALVSFLPPLPLFRHISRQSDRHNWQDPHSFRR